MEMKSIKFAYMQILFELILLISKIYLLALPLLIALMSTIRLQNMQLIVALCIVGTNHDVYNRSDHPFFTVPSATRYAATAHTATHGIPKLIAN